MLRVSQIYPQPGMCSSSTTYDSTLRSIRVFYFSFVHYAALTFFSLALSLFSLIWFLIMETKHSEKNSIS